MTNAEKTIKEIYIAGATAMAEKKNVECAEKIEGLREDLQFVTEGFMNVKAQLESTQAELESVRTALISETGMVFVCMEYKLKFTLKEIKPLSNTKPSLKERRKMAEVYVIYPGYVSLTPMTEKEIEEWIKAHFPHPITKKR